MTSEDDKKLLHEAHQEISSSVRCMIKELWFNWIHLGIDHNTRVKYITELVQIEKKHHRDVTVSTRQKYKAMHIEVMKLKNEMEELSRCLSVDVTLPNLEEDTVLVEYKQELTDQISRYREQMKQRRMKMERLLERQQDLADQLGVTIQELPKIPLPSEEELNQLENHLEVLQAERDKRAIICNNLNIEINEIMEKLQIKQEKKSEEVAVTGLRVKLNDIAMELLAERHQKLLEAYELTNNRVLELRERLTELWECLEEDQIYRENFLHAHPGCHPLTEAGIKEEIERCEKMKPQKLPVLLANVRRRIQRMWDTIKFSTREREEFVDFYENVFTEDKLTLHEIYLEKLSKYHNENKQIFDKIKIRKNIWLKMTELEARASEPDRYYNRGGLLLKEEKERKTIASQLSKIEGQIRVLVQEYQAKSGTPFTINGTPLLQLMEDEWDSKRAERHNKLTAHKRAFNSSFLFTSPPGKRNRTAPYECNQAKAPADNEQRDQGSHRDEQELACAEAISHPSPQLKGPGQEDE